MSPTALFFALATGAGMFINQHEWSFGMARWLVAFSSCSLAASAILAGQWLADPGRLVVSAGWTVAGAAVSLTLTLL